jgi:hypothetical protein
MLKQERGIGVRGLNLGTDPALMDQGWLRLADGMRYLEAGAAHTRGGRVVAGLEFPDEGVGAPSTYVDTIAWFKTGARCRGVVPYYDTRIWPIASSGTPVNIPQRLNFVHKTSNYMQFNLEDTSTGTLVGDILFNSTNTKAKFVVYGDRVYAIDESTPPKVMRRLPEAQQTYLTRIKYRADRMGIVWPTLNTGAQIPATTFTAAAAPFLSMSTFRFRIVLENQFGVQSGPSKFVERIITVSNITSITVDWSAIVATFPANVTTVRVYVQKAITSADSSAIEPSDYLYLGSKALSDVSGPGQYKMDFNAVDESDMRNRPSMKKSSGAPPTLKDMVIVNDVAYGIAATDVVFREIVESEVGTTTSQVVVGGDHWIFRDQVQNPGPRPVIGVVHTKLTAKTQIKRIAVGPSYLFWSEPGEPEYMENYVQVGNGTEILIGLAAIGRVCLVFTNQAIYTFDAYGGELKRAYSKVGALSRDSIVETERGIYFVGSDGVPRVFNGATVDEVADELLPIFDRDDYVGDYLRFDRSVADEVCATGGKRRFYMTYATSTETIYPKPGAEPDSALLRTMIVGDASHGRTQWAIDNQTNYDIVSWLGRETRLLAVNPIGEFFFIEEGEADASFVTGEETPIFFDFKTRLLASAQGIQGQFYRVKLDIDTQGQDVTLVCSVDDYPGLVAEFTVNTARRDEWATNLPGVFKGRFLQVRINGTVTQRVGIWGVAVQSSQRGNF